MLSKLTLIGMHNYSKGAIWDDIILPEGIEKDILVNEILKQNGEFCLLYPDLDFLKAQIDFFFKKWFSNFEKWINVINEEYDPLFNVDVITTFEEKGKNNEEASKKSNSSSSDTTSGNSSDTISKAAYDSNNFQNVQKDDLTSTTTSTLEGNSKDESSAESTHEIDTTEIKRGNQGITMAQELLLAEINVQKFNLYDQIADIFASEFCVAFYV